MSDVTRTEHAKSNIVASVVSYLVKMVCAFVSRTILIKYLGVMYLGLNGLFTGILSMLSLAELGIGSALVFSLYKPIADNDEEKVKQLLKLYKNTYTIIGFIVMGVGVCLMPFLNSLIADEATIPTNIKELPDNCFYGCGQLKEITIPKSVRDEISAFVKNNSGALRNRQECKSDYYQNVDGTYTVLLKILAPVQPMLELKFVVPDRKTASQIYKNWERKASDLYSAIYETLVD